MKNIQFTNVVFDLKSINRRAREGAFGMFAGVVADDAVVENVQIGGTYRIGAFQVQYPDGYEFTFTTTGKTDGITLTSKKLELYGSKIVTMQGKYRYYINPETVSVSGAILNLEFTTKAAGFESTREIITIEE